MNILELSHGLEAVTEQVRQRLIKISDTLLDSQLKAQDGEVNSKKNVGSGVASVLEDALVNFRYISNILDDIDKKLGIDELPRPAPTSFGNADIAYPQYKTNSFSTTGTVREH